MRVIQAIHNVQSTIFDVDQMQMTSSFLSRTNISIEAYNNVHFQYECEAKRSTTAVAATNKYVIKFVLWIKRENFRHIDIVYKMGFCLQPYIIAKYAHTQRIRSGFCFFADDEQTCFLFISWLWNDVTTLSHIYE